MTSPTNIRRVVTADDAEIQTFNTLNEDLKAQKAKMLRATADLEEVKASVPAAAKSAADLATAQAKNTLDLASSNANSAAAAALASLATLPKFRSADQTNPPNPTQAELDANPNGIWGVKLNADGVAQQLKWQPHTLAGSWQSVGAPPASAQQVERARLLAVIASAFDSTNSANPRNPTAEEIAAFQAANGHTLIGGSRINAEGWRQPLIWQGGAWVVSQALPKLDTGLLADIAQNTELMEQARQSLAATSAAGIVRANKAALDAAFASVAVGNTGTDAELGQMYLKRQGATDWGVPVLDLLAPAVRVRSVAAIRQRSSTGAPVQTIGYYGYFSGGGAVYDPDPTDASTPDNGADVIVGADGTRYRMRIEGSRIDIRQCGAIGDGTHDDAPAIQAADNALGLGGGEVFFPTPPFAWLLGSNATGLQDAPDSDFLHSCLYPNHNRTYRGTGWSCRIKVKKGLRETPEFINRVGPMGWGRQSVLKNTRWVDMWFEGSGDILPVVPHPIPEGVIIPSNAMVMVLNGGEFVEFDHVQVTNISGSQCIFFARASEGAEGVTVRNCRFWNNGEGVSGNYNEDHSSVYLTGDNNIIENNDFGCDPFRVVRGAAWEVHGSNYRAKGNNVWRYQMTFWIAPDTGKIGDIVIEDTQAYEVTYAWGFGLGQSLGHVAIRNSTFRQTPDERLPETDPYPFFAFAPQQLCDLFELDNTHLIGKPWREENRGLQLNLSKHIKLKGGSISGFAGGAAAHGNTELYGAGTGITIEQLEIDGVSFADNGPIGEVDFIIGNGSIYRLRMQNNMFSGDDNRIPWLIGAYVHNGQVGGNVIAPNYAQPQMPNATHVLTELYAKGAPSAALNVATGSQYVDRTNGDVYRKTDSGWSKSTTINSRPAPAPRVNPVTGTPTKEEFNALLDEVRDLKAAVVQTGTLT